MDTTEAARSSLPTHTVRVLVYRTNTVHIKESAVRCLHIHPHIRCIYMHDAVSFCIDGRIDLSAYRLRQRCDESAWRELAEEEEEEKRK